LKHGSQLAPIAVPMAINSATAGVMMLQVVDEHVCDFDMEDFSFGNRSLP